MRLEEWIAIGSLAMVVMFVVLLNSFYNFLIGPEGEGPERVVDPTALLIQVISISGAPGTVLAAVSFVMGRDYSSKLAGVVLVLAGVIMIFGMIMALEILPKIKELYVTLGMTVVPYVFVAIGAGISGMGAYLLRKTKKSLEPSTRDQFFS